MCRFVVINVAGFKVSDSGEIDIMTDIDTPALRAVRARSSSIGALKKTLRKVRKTSTHVVGSVRIHVGVAQ